MTTWDVTILSKNGPKKPSSAQIKSTSKDVTFEEDGETQPSVSL
jgi:hypothetical protein